MDQVAQLSFRWFICHNVTPTLVFFTNMEFRIVVAL